MHRKAQNRPTTQKPTQKYKLVEYFNEKPLNVLLKDNTKEMCETIRDQIIDKKPKIGFTYHIIPLLPKAI